MEVMRKWDIDLTDSEEKTIKNLFIKNQWDQVKNPTSNTMNVGQSVSLMRSVLDNIKEGKKDLNVNQDD